MGQQQSISYVSQESFVKIVTDVMISNNSNCISTQTSVQNQNNVIRGSNVGELGQYSNQTLDTTCLAKSTNDIDIVNKIEEKLTSLVESSVGGQNIGNQSTNAINVSRSIKDVANSINISNIKSCLSSQSSIQNQDNTVDESTVIKIIQGNIQSAISSCIFNDDNTTKALNDLNTAMEATAKSKATGLFDPLFIVLIILAIVLFFVLKKFLFN